MMYLCESLLKSAFRFVELLECGLMFSISLEDVWGHYFFRYFFLPLSLFLGFLLYTCWYSWHCPLCFRGPIHFSLIFFSVFFRFTVLLTYFFHWFLYSAILNLLLSPFHEISFQFFNFPTAECPFVPLLIICFLIEILYLWIHCYHTSLYFLKCIFL